MDSETLKTMARRFVEEVINNKNMAAFDELVSPGLIDHNPPPGGGSDFAASKEGFLRWQAAFPDTRYEIFDLVAEGDKVVVRGRISGTQRGEILGIPAAGRQISVNVMEIWRVDDSGLFIEDWNVADRVAMFEQLGVTWTKPEPASVAGSSDT
jgi:predicted ester cyclase